MLNKKKKKMLIISAAISAVAFLSGFSIWFIINHHSRTSAEEKQETYEPEEPLETEGVKLSESSFELDEALSAVETENAKYKPAVRLEPQRISHEQPTPYAYTGNKPIIVASPGPLAKATATPKKATAQVKYTTKADGTHEHSESDWFILKQPTCSQEGTYAKECLICHAKTSTKAIPKIEHKYEMKEPGMETYHTCAVCGNREKHILSEWEPVANASCAVQGVRLRRCSSCAYTVTEAVAASGHSYGEWSISKEPSCKSGTRYKVCQNCGNTISEDIPPTGAHVYENHRCIGCGKLEGGLYDANETFIIGYFESGIDASSDYESMDDEAESRAANILEYYPDAAIIALPSEVTNIGQYAFAGCTGIRNVYFADEMKVIGDFAFYECINLTEVDLTHITCLGNYSFANCSSLRSVAAGAKNHTSASEALGALHLSNYPSGAFDGTSLK